MGLISHLKLKTKPNYNNNENLLSFFGMHINLPQNDKNAFRLKKKVSDVKIHHFIVLPWKTRISLENRHFDQPTLLPESNNVLRFIPQRRDTC